MNGGAESYGRIKTVKLPGGDRAFVDLKKLREYCLDPSHPRGRHKARMFASRLGITSDHAAMLKEVLLTAAREKQAVQGEKDRFGARFAVEFDMDGPKGPVRLCSGWIIRDGEDFPRMTSCYVAKRRS